VHLERERDAAVAAQNALTEQNRTLSAKVADLTALLGSRTEAPPGIVAAVLARPPVSPYDELVLDAGEAEGVREGAAVYGNGGVPLGIVASVTAHAARVALYSAPGRETPALAGAARVPFTLVGAGAGAFTASVPRDAGVAVGDALYAGGAGSIPIGTVAAVDSDPSSPSAAIRIDPVANPFSITWVTVAPAP
jgi:cell shape-determining protein MreC